ncbi:MAG: T9SS type A sorting domain-containing protein [Bacteroidales bacterium]|jgi:hypothetical protein|nr:T9SS type A sorting domain-containing protein [Bacteroidales bacterium]
MNRFIKHSGSESIIFAQAHKTVTLNRKRGCIMKKPICTLSCFAIIVYLFIYSGTVQAQESYPEFAPVGAEWYYTYTATDPLKSCEHYRSLKDTVIGSKTCKMVCRNSDTAIFCQDEKKIYYHQNNEFHLIYDFGVNVGDTVCFSFKRIYFDPDSVAFHKIKCKVEDISVTAQNLKQFSTTLLDDTIIGISDWFYSRPLQKQYTYIEKIGHPKVFMETISSYIDAAMYTINLRCYHDNEFDFVTDWWQAYNLPCNSLSGIKNNTELLDITVYPNPATDAINIEIKEIQDYQHAAISLYNIHGICLENKLISNSITAFNVSHYSSGLYFIEIRQQNGRKYYSKFIKN